MTNRCEIHLHGWGHGEHPDDGEGHFYDRCTFYRYHTGDHRWPNRDQLRYVEGFDVVLVPDAVDDAWRKGEPPTEETYVQSDEQLATSRMVCENRFSKVSKDAL